MKRLGKLTKTIYDETYDFSQCPECCTYISDEEANDEEFIKQLHRKDMTDCVTCFEYPCVKKGDKVK